MSNSKMAEVTTPPIIGAAILFITSAPAWVAGDQRIGSKPNKIALTVITLGRMRCTAPSMTASCKSFCVRIRPAALARSQTALFWEHLWPWLPGYLDVAGAIRMGAAPVILYPST